MNVIKAQSLEMADLFATFSAGQRGVKEGTTRLLSHLENGRPLLPPCCQPAKNSVLGQNFADLLFHYV